MRGVATGYRQACSPGGHQQATRPWPGYLDTDLGQQTKYLPWIK